MSPHAKLSTMTFCFLAADGTNQPLDLERVFDVARGESLIRVGWSALIVFDPASGRLVELRDGPADVRGDCASEAEEVNDEYVCITYGIAPASLPKLRESPATWRLVQV